MWSVKVWPNTNSSTGDLACDNNSDINDVGDDGNWDDNDNGNNDDDDNGKGVLNDKSKML